MVLGPVRAALHLCSRWCSLSSGDTNSKDEKFVVSFASTALQRLRQGDLRVPCFRESRGNASYRHPLTPDPN